MAVDTGLLDRAAALKRDLAEFARQPRYDRAFNDLLAANRDTTTGLDQYGLLTLRDYFLLEHRLPGGRTVVEQFLTARRDLAGTDRQLVAGWHEVVQGPFEVRDRDGAILVVESLIDELTYPVRSSLGPDAFAQMPPGSFLLARLVPVGGEWMVSGPARVLPAQERATAGRTALELALRFPERAFRNPDKLAEAWRLQHADRERFIAHFGADLVVVPGSELRGRMLGYREHCRGELGSAGRGAEVAATVDIPAETEQADTVAMIYDEAEGLGLFAEYGLVGEVFADPGLLRRQEHREHAMSYLRDDSVGPWVLRRLADPYPDNASAVFGRLLRKPRFDWARDGEELLRRYKRRYYDRPARPKISPIGERLAAYASR